MTSDNLWTQTVRNIFCVTAFLSLAACDGANDPVYASPVQACDALPTATVSAMLESRFEESARDFREHGDSGFWMSSCTYFSEQSGVSISMMIRPNRERGDGVAGFEAYIEELAATTGEDADIEVTDGIGERAGWQAATGQLTAFSDDYSLIVSVAGSGHDQDAKREIASRIAATTLQAI